MAVQGDVKRMMQVNGEDQQLTRSDLNWVTKSLQVGQVLTPQNISSIYAKQSLSQTLVSDLGLDWAVFYVPANTV